MYDMNLSPDAPASVGYVNPATGETNISGNWVKTLLDNDLDINALRPYLSNDGRRAFITRNSLTYDPKTGEQKQVQRAVPVRNDNTVLRFLDWTQIDEAIIKVSLPRLRAAADLRRLGLEYSLPNGIAKTVMQFQQQSDITPATVSMDGIRQGESDRPVFSTVNFPLPLIHKDFQYNMRELLASRTGYSPLDTTTAELAGRKVAEQVEQLTLGTNNALFQGGIASFTNSGASVWGYMNFPNRISYSLTLPTAGGWTPDTTVNDVLQMKLLSQQAFHYGPWMVYFGTAWDPFMDNDYKATYNNMTLRTRLKAIDGILDVRTVDYIPGYSMLMVQMTSDVVRMVIGLDIVTVQWESHGGFQMNFKVICMMLPQLRTDQNLRTGIVHAA